MWAGGKSPVMIVDDVPVLGVRPVLKSLSEMLPAKPKTVRGIAISKRAMRDKYGLQRLEAGLKKEISEGAGRPEEGTKHTGQKEK